MKKTTAILAASIIGLSGLKAQEELSVTVTFEWNNKYIFRGAELGEETFMPAVDLSYGGFYAGIWAALPAKHTDENEVDFYAGYAWDVTDVVGADIGFTYYTFPDAQDKFFDSDVNTFEIYAGLTFESPLSPAIYIFRDFDLKSWTLEASAGESWEVAEDTTFDLGAHLGYVDIKHADNYWYFGLTGGFTYSINDYVSASAFLGWSWASEDNFRNGTKSNRLYYGLAVSAGF